MPPSPSPLALLLRVNGLQLWRRAGAIRHQSRLLSSLIGVFISLSCIYITLAAPFIAAVQVLIYAGAIMVLVIFVIMLLNLDDDRHVIEKMGLNYASLKNGGHEHGIHQKYGVQGWPTLVVLDGEGVVRHVHVGYSPQLGKELAAKIREILAGQVATN